MHTKQLLKSGLVFAATLSMLVACGPTPTTTQPSPSPSATTSAAPTAVPTAEPTAEPTAQPTASAIPTATPTIAPTATPTASSSSSSSASPTAGPTATSTSDISVVEKTTFNGKVYDDTNSPLDGVTVKARSLNSSVPYEATTTTAGGSYAFNNAPSGVQLEIIASKSGYATRRRVEVLKSNKTGDPNANRYDFGTDGSTSTSFGVEYNALSDKPEVISVTPGRNASGVNPDTSFVIKFSEPMDIDTVEENFGIFAATSEVLTVGKVLDGAEDLDSTPAEDEEADVPSDDADLIWDESAFDVSWNSDDTEVTFTFQDELQLPTDTESEDTPDYLVAFSGVDDGQLKDKSGVTRDESDGGYFKLTDGQFESWYDFSIDTDEEEPTVESVDVVVDDNGQDEIRVEFSEPMAFFTRSGVVAGGAAAQTLFDFNAIEAGPEYDGGSFDESPLNPNNYEIAVLDSTDVGGPGGVNPDFENFGSFAFEPIDASGSARFDSDDETNSTVLLQFVSDGQVIAGDRVFIRVSTDILDPAGNSVDSSNDEEDDIAN